MIWNLVYKVAARWNPSGGKTKVFAESTSCHRTKRSRTGLYIETSKDSAECNILIYLYSWFYIDPHLTFISDLFKKHLLLHRLCGILQFITNLI